MLRVIITDDEPAACALMRTLLLRKFPDIEILAICHDLPSAVVAIRKHKPDAVFLDIEMPNYSGLEIMDFLSEDEVNFEIVFVTAYSEYAIHAFRLSALDYLLKPVDILQLEETVHKLIAAKDNKTTISQYASLKHNLNGQKPLRICIPTAEGKFFFAPEQIIFFEAEGAYTHIYTTEKHLLVGKNIKYFDEMLGKTFPFMRVHRSYMVNLSFIQQIQADYSVLLKTGQRISIAKERLSEVEKAMRI